MGELFPEGIVGPADDVSPESCDVALSGGRHFGHYCSLGSLFGGIAIFLLLHLLHL